MAAIAKSRSTSENETSIDLDCLRNQIFAFQMLSRNLDVPEHIQHKLVDSLGQKEVDPVINNKASAPKPTTKEEDYMVIDQMSFAEREARLLPNEEGETERAAGGASEIGIRNRIYQRIYDLDNFASNLGTVNSQAINFGTNADLNDDDDKLKIQTLIELKSLRVLVKQKSMRQHLVHALAIEEASLARSVLTRAQNRRTKVLTPQELRLIEQLEREQRTRRERQERSTRWNKVNNVLAHVTEIHDQGRLRKQRLQNLAKHVLQAHNQIERDEAKKSERTAKQRLQALRANDEDAYLKLLDQTKDTRITHLLKQTNVFLESLAQAVKVQQSEGGRDTDTFEVESGDKADYYEVAHRIKESISHQPSILVGGTLKEYQIKGLQWMVSLYNNNLNGILADEMGLGKTIQSISLISYLIETKRQPGPYLVIVPLSTLTNWTLEFEKWAPSIKKVVYKGPPNARKSQQGVIRSGDFQVLLTTYEYIIKDRPVLSKIRWVHMIIDEGHRMKNTQSKLSATLTQYYYSRHRLILTGTPLQNNLPELWALLNFVLPKIFNSVKTFDEWFNTPFANTGGQDRMELTEEETLLIIRRLHKVLRPFLLRRLKKDVEKDLPDKVEKVIKCKMSALQTKLYDQMLKHNALFVGESEKSKLSIRGLNNRVMQLRKICNHPFVFEEVESLVNPSKSTTDDLWRVAGKFELLDRILPKLKATGHRVLMFFQMTQIMDIMEDYLRLKSTPYLRLDGSTKAEDRSELLKLFNAPESPYFCFLLSTRAGGLGLNLQTADTVVIFDTDWNPHQDLQAQDRAHRIGQTKEVRILRLITEDSVEEAILERALSKLDIDGKVIQAGKFDNKSTSEEQEAFLRSLLEAEEQRRDQKESESDDMDDEEINEILARSEEEGRIFEEMDHERADISGYGRNKPKDRLLSEEELPEAYKKDIQEHFEPVDDSMYHGRGARERKTIYYDDGLTEDQWLEAVDNDEVDLDSAIERKRKMREARRLKSQKNGLKEDEVDGSVVDELDESRLKRRKRQNVKNEDLYEDEVTNGVHEDGDDMLSEDEIPVTIPKRRGRPPASATLGENISSNSAMQGLKVIEAVVAGRDAEGRPLADLFMDYPDRSLYPEYYRVITNAIALNPIKKRIRDGKYKTLDDVKEALDLMVSNAQTFNEPGSYVYEAASDIADIVNSKYNELRGKHKLKIKLRE